MPCPRYPRGTGQCVLTLMTAVMGIQPADPIWLATRGSSIWVLHFLLKHHLTPKFHESTMTWKNVKEGEMVEWWGSGGDLGGGSFRALSFATEYSTSNYFTDSGNHLISNDDRVTGEFYQMSPRLLQTIQLRTRRREVFPWRDPRLPEGKIVACGGRFFSFQGFFLFHESGAANRRSCKSQIKKTPPLGVLQGAHKMKYYYYSSP